MSARLGMFALAGTLAAAGVAGAQGLPVPFCKEWDWDDHKRELTFCVNPAVDACVLAGMSGMDNGDDRTDPGDDVVDPTPGDGFTLGDAARVAADIWNKQAGTGWTLTEVPWNPDCVGCDIEIIKAKHVAFNDADEVKADILALHIQKTLDQCGHLLKAQICYNDNVPLAKWSINPADGFAFDPIIVMMHEIGHCLRLKDQPGVIGPPVVPPAGTSVMRGTIAAGVHRLNPGGATPLRNPSAADIAEAAASAGYKVWKPADFNEDGNLDVNDFLAFQTAFLAGNPEADIDANGALNIFDFIAFEHAFKVCSP